jgi:hypothetical protein
MKQKLSLASLNLQSISDVVDITLTPPDVLQVTASNNSEQTSPTTLKYSFNTDDGFVGLREVDLQFNINNINVQNAVDISIDATNVDDLNHTNIDLTDANKFFGASSINLDIELEQDKQIELNSTNKNDNFITAENTIGITNLTINPKLDKLSVDPVNDINTESSVDLINKSTIENVLGLDSVILPVREADKTYDVLLSTNSTCYIDNGSAEIINLSANNVPPITVTSEYFVTILGKHASPTIPMLNEVSYIEDPLAEDSLVPTKVAEIGDAVYLVSEGDIKEYYVYNGTSWVFWNFGEPFFVTRTKATGKTYTSDLTEDSLVTDPNKFGCRTVTINKPGSFDFLLKTPSKLLNLQNSEDEVVTTFTFDDNTHNLTNFVVPKIPVITKVISEEEITEALLNKQANISVIPEETSTMLSINGEEEEITLPVLFNSVVINLPDLENGLIVSSNQNDIAILETQVKNLLSETDPAVDITFGLTTQNKTVLEDTLTYSSNGVFKNLLSKKSYFINTNDKQEFNIKVHANNACTINVYQAPVVTNTTISKEDILQNKLFSFDLTGNTIIKNKNNESTLKSDNIYYITFNEDFNITEVSSENGEVSNLVVSGISIQYQTEDTEEAEKIELTKEEINAFVHDVQSLETRSTTYYYYIECINNISAIDYLTNITVTDNTVSAAIALYTQEATENGESSISPVTNVALTAASTDTVCLSTIDYLIDAENTVYKSFNLTTNANTLLGKYYYYLDNDIKMLRIDSSKIYLDDEELEYNYAMCKISDEITRVIYYDNDGNLISNTTFELLFNETFDKVTSVIFNNTHYAIIKDNIANNYIGDNFEILTVESLETPAKGTIYFPQIRVVSAVADNTIA